MLRKSLDRSGAKSPRPTDDRRYRSGLEAMERREMLSASAFLLGPTPAPAGLPEQVAAPTPDTATPTVDLTVQISPVPVLPSAATSGSGTPIKISFSVINSGTGAVPAGSKIVIKIFARLVGAADSSKDVLLSTLSNQGIGGLAVSAGKKFEPSIKLPASLATGSYNIVVLANATQSLPETNTANDSAVSSTAISVTQGNEGLSATSITPFIGTTVNPGDHVKGKGWVNVVVTNSGTVKLPAGQLVPVEFFLRPVNATNSSADILLATKNRDVGGLAPGKTLTMSIRLGYIPADVPAGVYKIVVVVDPNMVLPQTSATTNTQTTSQTFTATVAHQTTSSDLVITSATTNLHSIALAGGAGTATVGFSNLGNAQASGTYVINVYATTSGVVDANALLLGTSGSKTLSVAAGAAGPSTAVSFTLPTPAASTAYQLVVKVISTPADGNVNDNTDAAGSVTVMPSLPLLGFVGTTVTLVETVAPVTSGGQATSSGTFTDNNGNSGTYTYAASVGGTSTQGTLTFTLTGSKADTVAVTLTSTAGAPPTSLNGSVITFAGDSSGSSGTFSATVASEGVNVSGSYTVAGVDLVVTSATTTLNAINLGGATGTATVNFTNQGSLAASGTYTVNLYATTNGVIDSNSLLIGTSGAQTLALAAGAASGPVVVNVTLPSPASQTNYQILAQVVTSATSVNTSGNTLAAGTAVATPTLPLLGFIGTNITFTETSAPVAAGGQTTSSGTFTDSTSLSGNYTYVVTTGGAGNTGTLTMTVSGAKSDTVTLTLTTASGAQAASLAGSILIFQAAATGSTGSFSGNVGSEGTTTSGFYVLNPVDLVATSTTTTLPALAGSGGTGTVTVNFTNQGATAANGSFTVNIYATTNGVIDSNAVLVGTSGPQTLGLASGAVGPSTVVNVTLPTVAGTTAYTLVAQIVADPVASNPGTDLATVGTITVAPTLPLLGNFGTALTFTDTGTPTVAAGTITYNGTFTSTNGRSGTFTYIVNTSATDQSTLTLSLTTSPADGTTLTLTAGSGSAPVSLDGHTVTFQTSSTGSGGGFSGTIQSEGVPATGFYVVS